jgi:hypothetical protein
MLMRVKQDTTKASNGAAIIPHQDRPRGSLSLLYDGHLVSFPVVKQLGRSTDHLRLSTFE